MDEKLGVRGNKKPFGQGIVLGRQRPRSIIITMHHKYIYFKYLEYAIYILDL